jgi:hypothetical protein
VVLHLIEHTGNQSMLTNIVSNIIRSLLMFIVKMQHNPDLSTICEALSMAQTETNATAEHIA